VETSDNMSKESKPAGVILAGGRASRMGGMNKALVPLAGEPLVAHVIRRLRPQVGQLMISSDGSESSGSAFDTFGLPLVPDLLKRYRGPLSGLYAALHHLAEGGGESSLLLCPCDAPFVPLDLTARLQSADGGPEHPVAVVSWRGVLQPTFTLWHTSHLGVVQEIAVSEGDSGLKQVLGLLPHVVVEWEVCEPPPFYNVNSPGELKAASGWLDLDQDRTD